MRVVSLAGTLTCLQSRAILSGSGRLGGRGLSRLARRKLRPGKLADVVVRRLAWFLLGLAVVFAPRPTEAGKARTKKTPAKSRHACLTRLDSLRVSFRPAAPRKGIQVPVEVTGPLGGVTYRTWGRRALVLDCSLVYSLAMAGRYLGEAGITEAFFSSSYQRRNVRGTDRPSRHSYGLALDIHEFKGKNIGRLTIQDDYEQGLGDDVDCIGEPLSRGGAILRILYCRMIRSKLFRFILSPDYDEDHYNHFHVEALPWNERPDLSIRPPPAPEVAPSQGSPPAVGSASPSGGEESGAR
ncbi:MAG: hypothetical protein HY698_12760 [Deltaproteobacteria bacterium]|nr:hypothetical protein [Deltaproteobacteria bacterium]